MSVTAARGFQAGGFACGIKPASTPDIALVLADRPVPTAGVFTQNTASAAPVRWSQQRLAATHSARAVLLNSGCANAATGEMGDQATTVTATALAQQLDCPASQIQVCSTGPIGEPLPTQKIIKSFPQLLAVTSPRGHQKAANAILTTDRVTKEATAAGNGFVVGGMAKGAGMIRPDMATMLAVITTDAMSDHQTLDKILRAAVDRSFNSLNIDGCESTNDTVLLLASGITLTETDDYQTPTEELERAVTEVCARLATAIAQDAEGATKVVTLRILGADDDETARAIGKAVADSVLVRASFYGADPNWGRIAGALGAQRFRFAPSELEISYQGVPVVSGGAAASSATDDLSTQLTEDFTVTIKVGSGSGSAEVLTTDLTPAYVNFNADRS